MADSVWSEALIAELKRRWWDRESCSEIAAGLGNGITRNAVIGKIHRLGLAGTRDKPRLTEEERKHRHAKRQLAYYRANPRYRGKTMQDIPEAAPPPPYEGALNIPFCDLRPYSGKSVNQCRFIAAQVITHDVPACGLDTPPGASYCPHCAERLKPVARPLSERVLSLHMGIRRHQRALRRVA